MNQTFIPLHWSIMAVLAYGAITLAAGYYMGRRCRACQQRKREEARKECGDVLPVAGKVSDPVRGFLRGDGVSLPITSTNGDIRVSTSLAPNSPIERLHRHQPPTTDRLTDY